ncbi:MAG TPA: M56 family metallopeptidase [Blastocatellia bacterium]|nr:M56 family metallopeptidase [Blastocatellia bacterium]
MTSTISEAALALGHLVELSIIGKATIILVIGLTIVMLFRRARASVRHLLLAATLAAVLALPLIVWAAPEVTIGFPTSQSSEATDLGPAAPSVALTTPTGAGLPSRATESAPWSFPSWMTIFRTVWLAGAFWLLALLAVDLRRLYRTRREGLLWMESRELMQRLAGECGVRHKVEVLLHESIPGPLTCGIWRPAILLPDEASEWNDADLRRAIVHELEHVRRGDWAIQLAARATCIFYWLHPLVWLAFRRLSLEAERAADDAVVESAEHTEYAEQLVSLAGRLAKAQAQSALGMANRSDLSARVSALLDGSQRRGRAGWRPTAIALSVASLVVLAIAPVRAVTQSRKQTVAAAQAPNSQQTAASAQTPGSQSAKPGERVASGLDRALIRAAAAGDLAGIEELLRAGANVNCIVSPSEIGSPLIGAARGGRLDAVRLLLDWGANPNLEADATPLINAAEGGHVDVVSLLLDRGANIDHIDPECQNALIRASEKGRLEVVKLLVARGADVNAQAWYPRTRTIVVKNAKGETMIYTLDIERVKKDKIREIVKEIVKKDGTREIVDDVTKKGEWRTPLSMAKRGGHEDVVDFLLASGARE